MTTTNRAPAPTGMDADALAAFIGERLGEAVLDVNTTFGQLTLTVEPAVLPEAARLCKEAPELDFDFYDHNAGVDLGDEGFAVVTNLYSLRHRHRVLLRVVAPGGRETPTVPTLTHLWRGANWHEREVYDMFGIDFDGHPGLLPRILTVENFEGFPLRKDFLLSTREAKPWPGLKEPKEVGSEDEEAADATAAEAPVSAEEKARASQTRAERARAKAAAMRAKKQAEQEAAQAATSEEAAAAASARPDEPPDAQAAAAQETTGGDTGGEAAAQVAAAAGEPEPQTPNGAADIAKNDIAKDASAGTVGGDTAAGATGDSPDTDQPVHDPQAEAAVGEGAPPAPSGTPGVEAEGRRDQHEQGTDAPSASPYGERSRPTVEDGPEPSDTLDEVIPLQGRQNPDTPDEDDDRGSEKS